VQGTPHWVEPDLCSFCAADVEELVDEDLGEDEAEELETP